MNAMRSRRPWSVTQVAVAVIGLVGVAACGSRMSGTSGLGMQQAGIGAVTQQGQVDGATSGTTSEGTSTGSTGLTGGTGSSGASGTSGGTGTSGAAPGRTSVSTGGSGSSGGSGQPGGDGAPAGSVSISGPDSQGVSSSTIKIGVITPLSGAAGFLGEAQVASIRAYTSMINAKGGVHGKKLATVIVDNQFQPDLELSAARKLVENDKVFALMSVIGDAAGPYVTSKGIPNMVFGPTPPPFSSKYPTTYVAGMSAMDSVTRMAYTLKTIMKKPINTTAILYDSQNIPVGPWVKYMSKAWEVLGVTVKSTDAFNVSTGDCTNVVLKMQSLNIDFWQIAQSLAWPACGAAMARQGYVPPLGFGGPYTADSRFVGQAGAGAADVYGQNVGFQVERNPGQPYQYEGAAKKSAPEFQVYIDSLKRYSGNSANLATLESVWAQTYWVATQALVRAIAAQSKAVTWKGVNQWLQGQKSYLSGMSAPINFDPKCKSGAEMYMFQWKYDKASNQYRQTDWQPYGGHIKLPASYLNKIVPGAGACYLTKAADNEM
jgi:ABC-type branched-subunit amino acid transport system substrate-binding protein